MVRFWLHSVHSVHASSGRKVLPLRIKELGDSDSGADRISILAEMLSSVDSFHHKWSGAKIEVSLARGGLRVLNEDCDERLWLPLASSTIVHHESVNIPALEGIGNAAGLLAYVAPAAPQAFAWGSLKSFFPDIQPEPAENVWVFVVTSTIDFGSASKLVAKTSVLQMAMEELGAQGAIRGDTIGLTWLNTALGEGAFASVQLVQRDIDTQADAVNKHSPNKCALLAAKVLKERNCIEQAFEETGYLIAVQGHPNVLLFFGLFWLIHEDDEPLWVLMTEAHQEGDLQSRIQASGGLPAARALKYMEGLLRALVHIHSIELIHRDVKSENVILTADDRPLLIDIGIAAHASQAARLARKCGTPGSIAPEYLRTGECTVKGDVFGAGIAFYEALSGVRPLDRGGKTETVKANAKAKVSYKFDCFSRASVHITGLLRMMLTASSQRRHTSSVALEAASTLLARCEAEKVPAINTTALQSEPSLMPQVKRSEAHERLEETQYTHPLQHVQRQVASQEQQQQASPQPVEQPEFPPRSGKGIHRGDPSDIPPTALEHLNTCRSGEGLTRATQMDSPLTDLLREYRTKLTLKNESQRRVASREDTQHASLSAQVPPNIQDQSVAVQDSHEVAGRHGEIFCVGPADESSSMAPQAVAPLMELLREHCKRVNLKNALNGSFQSDDDDMSDCASVVSSIASEFSIASDLVQEWSHAVP